MARVTGHFDALHAMVQRTPEPSEALLERVQTDRAMRVFALYFGWLYATAYVGVWVVFLALVRRFAPRSRARGPVS